MEVYMKRPWTCKLCGESGLFSLTEKGEHLAGCQDEEEVANKEEEEEVKKQVVYLLFSPYIDTVFKHS